MFELKRERERVRERERERETKFCFRKSPIKIVDAQFIHLGVAMTQEFKN